MGLAQQFMPKKGWESRESRELSEILKSMTAEQRGELAKLNFRKEKTWTPSDVLKEADRAFKALTPEQRGKAAAAMSEIIKREEWEEAKKHIRELK
jgi:hypothetical protein